MNDYVKQWQASIGVTADGDFGPRTLAASLDHLDGPSPIATNDPPWVTEMKAVYGWHETRDNAKLRAWLKSDNKTLGDPKALPWCGDAVETAIKRALPNEPFVGALGANPYYARNWAMLGREGRGYGAVGVFSRGTEFGHVGFLVGEDDACYHVLGGNQGDAVNVTRIAKGRMIASRWPETYPVGSAALPRRPASLPVS